MLREWTASPNSSDCGSDLSCHNDVLSSVSLCCHSFGYSPPKGFPQSLHRCIQHLPCKQTKIDTDNHPCGSECAFAGCNPQHASQCPQGQEMMSWSRQYSGCYAGIQDHNYILCVADLSGIEGPVPTHSHCWKICHWFREILILP